MTRPRRCRLLLTTLAATFASAALVTAQHTPPSFRQSVDVIELDVRVLAKSGVPMSGLTLDKFDVAIGGKTRRVLSAKFVQYGDIAQPASASATTASDTATIWSPPATPSTAAANGRVYLLYVDTDSFDSVNSRNLMMTATAFVGRLQPNDMIGLFVVPVGSQIDPTTDHAKVVAALEKVVGLPPPPSQFALRPSEVALLSSVSPSLRQRQAALAQAICGGGSACGTQLRTEVDNLILTYESQATYGLHQLKALLEGFNAVVGRKTLVVISGGVPTTTQPGTRPDIGALDRIVGETAQRTNTTIYTLFVDWHQSAQASAETRSGIRTVTSQTEDSALFSRSLDVFTGTAGGTFLKVLSGRGEAAFDQILRETSAYYVLGVEPAESDRDGKARQLTVTVTAPGARVLGSRWVTVPRRP